MTKDYGKKGRGRKNRIAKARRWADWNQGIREGRVVRFSAMGLRCYNSPAAALAAVRVATEDGLEAAIVPPEAAQ